MGLIVVTSESFATASSKLADVSASLRRIEGQCAATVWFPPLANDTMSAEVVRVASYLGEGLEAMLAGSAQLAMMLSDHLTQAREWYEGADNAVRASIAFVSDTVVANLFMGLAGVAAVGGVTLLGWALTPVGLPVLFTGVALVATGAIDLDGVGDALGPLVASPMGTTLLRLFVSSSDEIVEGIAMPWLNVPGLSWIGALPGVGFKSPQDVAGALHGMQESRTGASRFRTAPRAVTPLPPPTSVTGLLNQIPTVDSDGAQVRISEYRREDGSTVHLVAIAGTSSMEFGGDNAFDNRGNLGAYSGDEETVEAVELAMAEAGIGHGDAVVFAGYSQGALVATRLAASEQWKTQSVLTAGTPVHGNEVGGTVPVVQLEHLNDPIPALDGLPRTPQNDVTVVLRNPHPEGVPPGGDPLAGHAFSEYLATAREYDGDIAPQYVGHRAELLAPLAGTTAVSTTEFRLIREFETPPVPEGTSIEAPGPDSFDRPPAAADGPVLVQG